MHAQALRKLTHSNTGTDQKTYYVHYVNGEWWLGAHLDRQHGYLYIKSYCKNPLELGGGGGGFSKSDTDDGVFKYDDDTKRSSSDVKEELFDDVDDMVVGTWCLSVVFEREAREFK